MTRIIRAAFFMTLAVSLIWGTACISNDLEGESPEPLSPVISPLEGFYEDSVYGFSLNYPRKWQIREGGPSEAAFLTHNAGNTCVVQVFVEELSGSPTLEAYSAGAIASMERQLADFRLLYQQKVLLGESTGYEQAFTGLESSTYLRARLICLVRDNQVFSILATADESLYGLLEETVDNIIYSFRLQEPVTLADFSREDSLILYGVEPITLDPAVMLDSDSATYLLEIFGGLVTLNQDLEIVPDLAERWEISDDGRVYTFYLRENARFHNGKQVTAHDFKYSLERTCDPETGSQTAGTYLGDILGVEEKLSGKAEEITGVRVIDDHILEITLDAPKAHFLSKLLYSTAFVVDEQNVEAGEEWWRQPNGTGPFKVRIWKKDSLLVLERNELYHREIPSLRNVVFRLWGGIPMVMYENDEIDITDVPGASIERILEPDSQLNQELIIIPELSLTYIGFNAAEPPFDDPLIRQAFAHAIDKEKLIEVLFHDLVEKADGILPPGMPGYNDQVKGLEFNPEKARALISQSKYGSVENLPPIIYTTSGMGYVSVLTEALIDMWQENLGVRASIRQIDPAVYTYTIREEKNQLFDIGWFADYPDPQNFLDILFYSGNRDNIGEYSNPLVDIRLEEAREELDDAKRQEMYREIEQMLIDDAACLPLYFGKRYVLVKPYVKGYIAAPLPIPWLMYISIEPH